MASTITGPVLTQDLQPAEQHLRPEVQACDRADSDARAHHRDRELRQHRQARRHRQHRRATSPVRRTASPTGFTPRRRASREILNVQHQRRATTPTRTPRRSIRQYQSSFTDAVPAADPLLAARRSRRTSRRRPRLDATFRDRVRHARPTRCDRSPPTAALAWLGPGARRLELTDRFTPELRSCTIGTANALPERGHHDPAARATAGAEATRFNYDLKAKDFLNQRLIAHYNAQCCGIAVEYQKFNFGTRARHGRRPQGPPVQYLVHARRASARSRTSSAHSADSRHDEHARASTAKRPARASEAKRATRTERAGEAARERACRGVRGAKPLGKR